ncbi:reverse transcriptase domain-containing protein [Tanacetum coccineum]|uniref:Reverse transcriptase domain-containing protein n=1 Tax=Tanacetum coccineum TaxID=301880 RepID=A0ABQ5G9A5_9ASTR
MVFKFLSKYFPYSRTLQLRKEILNFRQLPLESVFEAWERFKSCLPKCPDHRILLLNQILTFYYGITMIDQERLVVAVGDSDESDDDEPSEMIEDQKLIHHLSGSPTPSYDPLDEPLEANKSEIKPLIREPPNTFLMRDEEIELNSHEDIDDLVSIPRVSEKPLDSLDCIYKTFDVTITDPLFDFDSKFTLNLDNQIFSVHNKESDESETETIMDEV